MNLTEILKENDRRKQKLFSDYDPITGIGSPIPRKRIVIQDIDGDKVFYLPQTMFQLEVIKYLEKGSIADYISMTKGSFTMKKYNGFIKAFNNLRFEHDFEFWAIKCLTIYDKTLRIPVKFKLNKPQRKLLLALELLRLDGVPIRIILLKARQWGGSTLVEAYMAWIQLVLTTGRNSFIIAMDDNQARNIRAMYTRFGKHYPLAAGSVTFVPYEGSNKNRVVRERDCVIGVGSVNKPDATRSFDVSMLHASEVGLWRKTPGSSPEDLIQTIASSIMEVPLSMIVKESTAKGVGNYFHREWKSAKAGDNGYTGVFIAWYEIEMYYTPVKDYAKFIATFTEYEWFLWESGATIENISWYRKFKHSEKYDDWRMQSEFPTNDLEAFQSTGRRAFAPIYVHRSRKFNRPAKYVGDLFADAVNGKDAFKNLNFQSSPGGEFHLWALPDVDTSVANRYCVSLDIGGRSHEADYSVITVIDRFCMIEPGGIPEAIGTWRGHLDQDLVIWKAVQTAYFFNKALFIPESNSMNTSEETEGNHFLTILDEIVDYYDNIYTRTKPEAVFEGIPAMYGFHTNKQTKVMLVNLYNKLLREMGYIEYDERVCDEADVYEIKDNGSYGNVEGQHDDVLVSRMIGLFAAISYMNPCKYIDTTTKKKGYKVLSEATM